MRDLRRDCACALTWGETTVAEAFAHGEELALRGLVVESAARGLDAAVRGPHEELHRAGLGAGGLPDGTSRVWVPGWLELVGGWARWRRGLAVESPSEWDSCNPGLVAPRLLAGGGALGREVVAAAALGGDAEAYGVLDRLLFEVMDGALDAAAGGGRRMKTITMGELRAEPGEVVRAVQRRGESFRITKAGKPAARLVPDRDEDTVEVLPDGTVRGDASLLAGVADLRRGAGY